MSCICRVVLDAFWSRARGTVTSNANRFREMIAMSFSLGFEPPYDPPPGPLPSYDHCGYKVAILMVYKSLQPGRYSESYSQWDTIQKIKSNHSNQSRIDRLSSMMAGAYFCFCYVVSLRSPEGLMVDLPGLIKVGESIDSHVIIPLLGQVKGEDHTRQHLLHCVNITGSGISVRNWLVRLKTANKILLRTSGLAFVDPTSGKQSTTAKMNDFSGSLGGSL